MPAIDELAARAHALRAPGKRTILGLCGPPGAGKSTLAAALAERLGPEAAVLAQDGFHLNDPVLAALGAADRKGAPDTFDAVGFAELLARVRADGTENVCAPVFDRRIETAIAGAVPIRPAHRLVIVEGNYLLLDSPGWRRIRGLLDACWYLDPDPAARRRALVERHRRHGRSAVEAERWVAAVDDPNADLVARTRHLADAVIGW